MVWSDPEIKKLSKEFVTVADEVYMLYPEDPHNLNRVKDRPDHQFFKKFGESMPKGAWNHPGTKQGIYMMGPNAEYLEGRFAASSDAGDIRNRLQRALQRWETIRAEKGYANQAVPAAKATLPPGVTGKLILRANLRDLPRGSGDKSGARFTPADAQNGNWNDFIRWAWNENWIGLPDPKAFVPTGGGVESVQRDVAQRIAMEVLVDNVRGQAPTWRPEQVKEALIEKQRIGTTRGIMSIRYSGRVRLEDGARGYDAQLVGRGEWDETKEQFVRLDLAVVGMRRGAARFNRRENDPGPAPMGVALSLHKP